MIYAPCLALRHVVGLRSNIWHGACAGCVSFCGPERHHPPHPYHHPAAAGAAGTLRAPHEPLAAFGDSPIDRLRGVHAGGGGGGLVPGEMVGGGADGADSGGADGGAAVGGGLGEASDDDEDGLTWTAAMGVETVHSALYHPDASQSQGARVGGFI